MTSLSTDRFPEFFRELHGRDAYSWQVRLAARAVDGEWPDAINLPTGSGKTACIDIAVFALACQAARDLAERAAPRRIFFCVNRRVIVDEAYQRARRIAKKLWEAERGLASVSPVLIEVAAALRLVAGTNHEVDAPPLDVLELRGGIYRDNQWARSAAQPTVVCSTIDQLGSRLLFRGYGVSPNAAPIQAALVAYDSLVLLDEAHISQPFRQSIERVRGYLDHERWARESIGARPMVFVPMTATPPDDTTPNSVIQIDELDRANESLSRRLQAAKIARLYSVPDVPKAIAEHAAREAAAEPVAVGIIVNRVATAKEIYRRLREKHPDAIVELVIGSMQAVRAARRIGRPWPTAGERSNQLRGRDSMPRSWSRL
jgi:CRISPR-associated endonuclease/helicase Cas3